MKSSHSRTRPLLVLATVVLFSCGARSAERAPKGLAPTAPIEQLWQDPGDIGAKDLLLGPEGQKEVPDPRADYKFLEEDTSGHSNGYVVEDPKGRKWKVKVGNEAQSELVASRILWAIGFHQPVEHYVAHWRLTGGPVAQPEPGRFRLDSDHKNEGDWSWTENPFVGTRELRGLIVANFLVNNWDLNPTNNRIYRMKKSSGQETRYVVQDLGAALGKARWWFSNRNDIESFEKEGFIAGVEDGHVRFDYHGRHRDLLKGITPEDVAWVCGLLSQLSHEQLRSAFRAASYSEDVAERFVRKLEERIRQGAQQGGNGSSSLEDSRSGRDLLEPSRRSRRTVQALGQLGPGSLRSREHDPEDART